MLEGFRQEYALNIWFWYLLFVLMWIYLTISFIREVYKQLRIINMKEKEKGEKDQADIEAREMLRAVEGRPVEDRADEEHKCNKCMKAFGID